MENDDFANVSWQSDSPSKGKDTDTSVPRPEAERVSSAGSMNGKSRVSGGVLGQNADVMDLAGVGDATLECIVNTPIKENDGSKDAYVSYLVTTHVSPSLRGQQSWC